MKEIKQKILYFQVGSFSEILKHKANHIVSNEVMDPSLCFYTGTSLTDEQLNHFPVLAGLR